MGMENTILKNDANAIKFRRDRSTLVILGVGVIVFGFWSIIKLVAYIIMDIPIYNVAEMDGFEEADLPLLMNTLYVVLSVDVIVRLIVGLNAISEARGKKNGGLYLAFNVWMILVSIFSVASVIWAALGTSAVEGFLDNYVSMFMELSSLVISIEVYLAALYVRQYKAKEKWRKRTQDAG